MYDAILLFGILFIALLPLVVINGNPDEWKIGRQIYLLAVAFIYFGWFWTHGGQTLGLRTWKLKVESVRGNKVTWRQAGIRFLVAILSWSGLGLGFLWVMFDKEARSWHDIAAGTRTVRVDG